MCCVLLYTLASQLFFFNAPPPPGIYPLSLHDALPIWEALRPRSRGAQHVVGVGVGTGLQRQAAAADAAGEAVAQRREVLDPVRELITPLPGDARPVLGGGYPLILQRVQSLLDHLYKY